MLLGQKMFIFHECALKKKIRNRYPDSTGKYTPIRSTISNVACQALFLVNVAVNNVRYHTFHDRCAATLSNAGERARACFCGVIGSFDRLSDVVDNEKSWTTRFDRMYYNVLRLFSSHRHCTENVMPDEVVILVSSLSEMRRYRDRLQVSKFNI